MYTTFNTRVMLWTQSGRSHALNICKVRTTWLFLGKDIHYKRNDDLD